MKWKFEQAKKTTIDMIAHQKWLPLAMVEHVGAFGTMVEPGLLRTY